MFSMNLRRGAQALRSQPLVIAGLSLSVVAAPLAALAQTPSRQSPSPVTASAPLYRQASSRMIQRETVDQRLALLHASLKISPSEEPQWAAVAQAMRENEAAMEKLTAETNAKPHPLNAVEDLRTYERFTQAHVNGLKNLISSFETLYQAMPDSQKATADQVFRRFGARNSAHAG